MAENKPTDGKKISEIQKFTDTLARYEASIIRVLGDKGFITKDEFIMSVINTVKGTPQLLKVDDNSLFAAIFVAAELQLKVSTKGNPEGLCYILPFKGKAQFLIGYRGLIEIAYRSNVKIIAEPVYANEFYVQDESNYKFIKYTGMLINELQLIKAQKDFLKESGFSDDEINEFVEIYKKELKNGKGDLKLVYAACHLEGFESPIFKSVTLDVLKKIEAMSPSTKGDNSQYSPYLNGTDAHSMMQVKAAIKLLFKFLPKQRLDKRMAEAIEYDDAAMSGKVPVLEEGDKVRMVDAKEVSNEAKSEKYRSHFDPDMVEDTPFEEEITPQAEAEVKPEEAKIVKDKPETGKEKRNSQGKLI